MLVVADEEGAGCCLEGELEFALFQRTSIVIAEHGHQHLAAQIGIDGIPVDVEVAGVDGGFAVLQNVEPPRVIAAHDAHVIRHHVKQLSHAVARKLRAEPVIVGGAAKLGVECMMIDDVITVFAAGARTQMSSASGTLDTRRATTDTEWVRVASANVN